MGEDEFKQFIEHSFDELLPCRLYRQGYINEKQFDMMINGEPIQVKLPTELSGKAYVLSGEAIKGDDE